MSQRNPNKESPKMSVVHSYETRLPYEAALKFSAILAADKGVPSELVKTPKGWDVVADDGKTVSFILVR